MAIMDPNRNSLVDRLEAMKFDQDKLSWRLLPIDEVEEVVRVLNYGANKYAPNNWKLVEQGRYEDALIRHMVDFMRGEKVDPESGLPHMAHVACNALFIMWKENQLDRKDKEAK